MTDESLGQPPSSFHVALVASLPCVAVGAWRLPEMIEVGVDARVAAGYPSWFIAFLWLLVLGPLIVGTVGTLGALLARSASPAAPHLLRSAGALIVVWAIAQTWIRVQYDPDIAFGGLIWGLVHNLTLTREVDVGATPSGRAGYTAGLVIGGAVWVGAGLLLLMASARGALSVVQGSPSNVEVARAVQHDDED